MKLLATLEEKELNRLTYLYIDEMAFKIYGFSLADDRLVDLSSKIGECFKVFSLSNDVEIRSSANGEMIVLDKKTGLVHYFKDGKEDIERLFWQNGMAVVQNDYDYKPYRGKRLNNRFRKFILSSKTLTFLLVIDISLFSIFPYLDNGFYFNWDGEIVDIKSGVTYALNLDDKKRFDPEVELIDLRHYIYEESNINSEVVKDFIYNPVLLLDVLSYYQDSPMTIIAKMRHLGINVVPYTEEEKESLDTRGYYNYDNVLHVCDWDEENFDPNSSVAKTSVHEYVHLLETSTCYPFVSETICELIVHEYFKYSTVSTGAYSYGEDCNYLRILMELIGPEPVWDNAFRHNSSLLDDSVRQYLTEDEYRDFVTIMNCSPYYQNEELSSFFPRFREILNNLSLRKYGHDMYEDEMIKAILDKTLYSRAYFKETLMDEGHSYYEIDTLSAARAVEEGYLEIFCWKHTGNDSLDGTCRYSLNAFESVEVLCEHRSFNVDIVNNELTGIITLNDGEAIDLDSALKRGLVRIVSTSNVNAAVVPVEEYLQNPESEDYMFFTFSECSFDGENKVVRFDEPRRVYVEPINKKFGGRTLTMG